MKILLLSLLLFSAFIYSQTFKRVEYFIDSDPGYNNGTPVTIPQGTDISLDFTVPVTSLTDGIHILFIRAQNVSNAWSISQQMSFLKQTLAVPQPVPSITSAEYYIDTDPGFGYGTPISGFTPGTDITIQFTANISSVNDGCHIIYVRTKDANGKWSNLWWQSFFKQTLTNLPQAVNIVQAEYFIDTDPGFGAGIPVTIMQGQDVVVQSAIDINTISAGVHQVFLRVKDANGRWSNVWWQSILKQTLPVLLSAANIVKAEYFIDSDPGFGAGTPVTIAPGTDISGQAVLDISSISSGVHKVFIRAKDANDKWFNVWWQPFAKEEVANITPLAKVNKVEYFFNADPGFGGGINIPVSDSTNVAGSFFANITALPSGINSLYVRALNADKKWSMVSTIKITLGLPAIPKLYSPANNSINQPLAQSFKWSKSLGAYAYQLQAAKDSFFVNIVYDDTTLSDTNNVVPNLDRNQSYYWRVRAINSLGLSSYSPIWGFKTLSPIIIWTDTLTIKENAAVSGRGLQFGTSPQASDGLDGTLNEYSLPPVPPAGIFDIRFEIPSVPVDYAYNDYRNDTVTTANWIIRIQPLSAGYPYTITWNPSLLPAGSFRLKDSSGAIVNVDMRSTGSYTLTNTSVTILRIEYRKQLCGDISLLNSWNIISIPLTASPMTVSGIFPAANSPAYGYNNGYQSTATFENGRGYWLRFPAASSVTVCGTLPANENQVPVIAGWNLVGVYDKNIITASISTTPANIINSNFYGYNNGYQTPRTLVSGNGYWVRVTQAGFLNLSAGAAKTGSPVYVESVINNKWNNISIVDASGYAAKLYLADGSAVLDNYSLPPLPPDGVFDARFTSQSFVETLGSTGKTISISGASYPVEISVEGVDLSIKDKATGKLVNSIVKSGSSIVIKNKSVTSLEVSAVTKPTAYELQQNYPNPFNPSTIIRFGLPENARVRLTIYNQIGEQVAELVNGQMEAGYHQVTWNAANMSSGVYFYEIKAEKFRSVKKLVVIK